MQDPRHFSDQELIVILKQLVEKERLLEVEILHFLREVEVRKIHLARGYPDLYRFAQVELGLSSGAAYRRVSAMRLLQTLPELEKDLRSGELKLESASQAQSAFRKENLIRREKKAAPLTTDEKRDIAQALVGQTTREAADTLMKRLPEVAAKGEENSRPVADGKTEIQFVATPELKAKLDELKGLLAHQNYEGRMDVLIEKLADIALKKLKPGKRALAAQDRTPAKPTQAAPDRTPAKPTQAAQGSSAAATAQVSPKSPATGKTEAVRKRSRHIPAQQARAVFLRDYPGGCAFQDPETGRRCGSRHGLQRDHQVPFSLGGSSDAENLRLLCGSHNRFRAEKMGLGNRPNR